MKILLVHCCAPFIRRI